MIINIQENNEEKEYLLFNYLYVNQRFFANGIERRTGEPAKFISTKGFDTILKRSSTGISYNFTKKYFNPYLCDKEKEIFKESIIIQTPGKEIKDIGPSNFTGNYEIVKPGFTYRDDMYFEHKPFKVEGFDLFRYQNDDLYFTQYHSSSHNTLPKLVNIFDAELYEKIQITHGVNTDGVDYFDLNSLIRICDAELGYPDKNSFYNIIRAAGITDVFRTHKIGALDFVSYNDIIKIKKDCGNAYIQKNINKKLSKRKFAFRYLYEYFEIIESMVSSRRKQSISPKSGPKEFKKEEFLPIFNDQSLYEFKIVYFKDIFTIERKTSTLKTVPGDPIFYIDGYYDFKNGMIKYYNFDNTSEIAKKIKEKLGITTSMRFSKCISEWFPSTFGYVPQTVKLKMSQKANSSPLSDNLTIYTIPIHEEGSDDVFGADTYVNLYEFLANFAIHIPQIRNMLNANRFSSKIFTIFDMTFPVFHVCRDTRRKIYEFNEENDCDTPLASLMIPITYVFFDKINFLLNKSGEVKNSYWYSNLNRLSLTFPPGSNANSIYSPKELTEFLNEP